MTQYSLASYFQNMKTIGSPLKAVDEENFNQLREIIQEYNHYQMLYMYIEKLKKK